MSLRARARIQIRGFVKLRTPEIVNSCSNSSRRGQFWLLARGWLRRLERVASEVAGKMDLQDICRGGEARDWGEKDRTNRGEGARERNSKRGIERERGREQEGSLNSAGERKSGRDNEFSKEAMGNMRKEEIRRKRRGNHWSKN